MKVERFNPEVQAAQLSGEPIQNWLVGRIYPTPATVPERWKLVRLTSVATLESGHTPSRSKCSYWAGGNIPWISLHDSQALDGPAISTTAQAVTPEGIQNSSARLLPKGTVVFSRTATVGKSTIMGTDMATSQDFANFVCGEKLHNRYLMYLFRFMAPEWKRLMAGSTHNTIYMPTFEALQILLPPRTEQEAIAEALGDADTLIDALERLLAKKRDLKQGAMQDLLTGKRRLPGFRTPWITKTIGDLYVFKNGLNKAKKYFGSGTPIVNYMDVYHCSALYGYSISGSVSVSSDEIRSYGACKGDVFFTRTSETQDEIGMTAVLLADIPNCVFSGFLLRGRPRCNAVVPEYAQYCFSTQEVRSQIVAGSSYTTRALTNGRALSRVSVRLPPADEQVAIAEILSDMGTEIDAVAHKLAKARNLKLGMMQELLTGRTRLI